ncbi:MAG: GNAT family N-acetyltransferase [Bacteroidales bacterium]
MLQCKVIKYVNPNDFLEDIGDFVDARHFGHFLFIRAIDRLLSRKEDIYSACTVKRGDQIEIIYMWTNHGQYIYGEHQSQESIQQILSSINFDAAVKSGLFGSKLIIDEIIKESQENYSLVKHRLYYQCNKLSCPAKPAEGQWYCSNLSDLNEISTMALEFYHEEFEGKGLQTTKEIIDGITNSIEESRLFYWRYQDEIKAYVNIIDDRNDKIMIGSVFTKLENRNKGYGKTLVYEVLNSLCNYNEVSFGFMVNPDNIASIKMFSALGFHKTYETGIYEHL